MPPAPSSHTPAGLPVPDADARAHSGRVVAHIARSISTAAGWIPFADYMGMALYAPGLGYYAAGARKFGAAGDFVTAPELTPLFGKALATQVSELVAALPGADVIELGPGTGRLAGDIIEALAARDALPARYCLLEVSPDLRERQRQRLEKVAPALLRHVEWIEAIPQRWRGVVIANEVLDAIPPHLVARKNDAWFERGVALGADGGFRFEDRPLAKNALRDAAQERFPPGGDYVSEINPAAQALVESLARHCDAGALLLVDYGFPSSEYYHAQRQSGTLMAHYRHHALADPFFFPGLADLTAHVDFTAIARAGVAGGMTVAGYTTQARFLVNCGILDALLRSGDVQSAAYLRQAAAVQKLLSPSEMGELFKVMAMTRGVELDLAGFRDGDMSHRL